MSKDSQPINSLHLSLAHASYEGFPLYEYESRDWSSSDKTARITKQERHTEYHMSVYSMFSQEWSSTAMGFGGLGGQAITSAYTVIIQSERGCGFCVYFGGRFAYRIEKPNQKFFEDVSSRQMSKVAGAKALYERTN